VKGEGRYRIHTVSELTGVPEATLRAWERRYAVPVPERTPSGYRLYSHKDVELVKRMRELTDNGMAPVDAARLAATKDTAKPAPQSSDVPPFEAAANRIVDATRRLDPPAIEHEVRVAMTLSDARTVVEEVFRPALATIGRDWERGIISIGHEHLASEIISVATRDMLRLLGPSRPLGDVVLACFADEDHTMPLYAAAFRFAEWGYRPRVLGARTPPAALGAVVAELTPALVGLSVTIEPPQHRVYELVMAYADVIGKRPWVVGGAAAESIRSLVENHGGRVIATAADSERALGEIFAARSRG
jgi:DNA-binding transcriptional MerR regulator